MLQRVVVFISLSLLVLNTFASPAAWYKWRSKEDGTIVCSQVPLGEGWEALDGPYKDLQCRVPGKPG
jgi:hypothetical protein